MTSTGADRTKDANGIWRWADPDTIIDALTRQDDENFGRLSEIISGEASSLFAVVTDSTYGADSTGSRQTHTEIQAAIDAVEDAGGGFVFIPGGTYLLGDHLRFGSNVHIFGAGAGAVTLKLDDEVEKDVFRSRSEGTDDDWIEFSAISDLSIDGNKSNQLDGGTFTSQPYGDDYFLAGIRAIKCRHCNFYNIHSHDNTGYGVEVKLSEDVLVRTCWSIDNGDDGFSVSDTLKGQVSVSRDVDFVQCFSKGHVDTPENDLGATRAGFEVDDGPKRVTFDRCIAESNRIGFEWHVHTGEEWPEDLFFYGCVARDSGHRGVGGNNLRGALVISGGVIEGKGDSDNQSDNGITIITGDGSLDVQITDITIRDASQHGISATSTNRGLRIRGVKVENAGVDGIRVAGTWEWLKISDTEVVGSGDFGMELISGSTIQEVVCRELTVKDTQRHGVVIRHTGKTMRMSACDIFENNRADDGDHGVYLLSGCDLDSFFFVGGNRIWKGDGTFTGHRHGLRFESSADVDEIVVSENDFTEAADSNSLWTSTAGNYRIIYNTIDGIVGDGNVQEFFGNRGFVTENRGTETQSGDGSTTGFSWAHGLDATPTSVNVNAASSDAAGSFHVSWDGTNITVTYGSAPASGTDNLEWSWEAKR